MVAGVDVVLHDYLAQHSSEFVTKVVDRFYAQYPDVAEQYGDAGRAHCEKDMQYHLTYLEEALSLSEPKLWVDYIDWSKSLLQARNIDVNDLKQCLVIMQDLFAEELPAETYAVVKDYIDQSLHNLDAQVDFQKSFIDSSLPFGDLTKEYTDLLVQGERQQASKLILDVCKNGMSIPDLYEHVFRVSQYEIGRLWQMNCISIAQEHYVTAATQLIMSQLYEYIFSSDKEDNGLLFVGACVGEEIHELGLRMVADLFEMAGWRTFYAGSHLPFNDLFKTIEDRRPDVIGLSATIPTHVGQIKRMIEKIRIDDNFKDTKVLVGGRPFNMAPQLWQQVGANGFAQNGKDAIALAEKLVG